MVMMLLWLQCYYNHDVSMITMVGVDYVLIYNTSGYKARPLEGGVSITITVQ